MAVNPKYAGILGALPNKMLRRPAAGTGTTAAGVNLAPQQFQGRDVVTRGGQSGIVGRGGNFQLAPRLGAGAGGAVPTTVTPLGARTPPTGMPIPWTKPLENVNMPSATNQDTMSGAERPGIESAIQNIKAQLGQSAPALAAGTGVSGASPSPLPMTKPFTEPVGTAADIGLAQPNRDASNPYLNILRRRMSLGFNPGGAAAFGTGYM